MEVEVGGEQEKEEEGKEREKKESTNEKTVHPAQGRADAAESIAVREKEERGITGYARSPTEGGHTEEE